VKDCAINVHFLRLSGARVKIAAARGLIAPEFETFDWRQPRRFLFVGGGKKTVRFSSLNDKSACTRTHFPAARARSLIIGNL
jgi:hypothetical protein